MSPEASRLAAADRMLVAMAGEIRDGDLVGVGLGTPLAVMAALLARATHAPGAHVLSGGAVDVDADLETCLAGPAAVHGRTPGYVSHVDSMDMAERQTMTLQFLRPAQVDGAGNLNTSRIGAAERPRLRFPGGLATGDVPALLPRLVVYLPRHELRALPERVSCVTGSGSGWDIPPYRTAGLVRLVTDRAIIAFGSGAPRLVSLHAGADLDDVVAATGFRLAVPSRVPVTAEPDAAQRQALTGLDPTGRRAAELGGARRAPHPEAT